MWGRIMIPMYRLWLQDCVLYMWGRIMIPMYRLWLQDLYGLHGLQCLLSQKAVKMYPDSKGHRANMGPTWVLSAPAGPHVNPMNLAISVITHSSTSTGCSMLFGFNFPIPHVSWLCCVQCCNAPCYIEMLLYQLTHIAGSTSGLLDQQLPCMKSFHFYIPTCLWL